jgi:hypothetical protein
MARKFDYDDLHRRWLAGETHAAIGAAYGMSGPAVAVRVKRVRAIEGEARWPWRAKSRHSAAVGERGGRLMADDMPQELVDLFYRTPGEDEPRLTARDVFAELQGQQVWYETHSVEAAKAAYWATLTFGLRRP